MPVRHVALACEALDAGLQLGELLRALVALPLALFPYIVALLVWEGVTLGGYIAVMRRIVPGRLGMWLAINAHDRLDRLVLCCTAARMMRPTDYGQRAARVRAEGMAAIAETVEVGSV